MKKFLFRHVGEIVMAIATIVCVFFFIQVTALVKDYSDTVDKKTAEQAEFYTLEQKRYVLDQCEEMRRETKYFAEKLSLVEGGATVDSVKNAYLAANRSDDVVEIGYYKGDAYATWSGQSLGGYPEIVAATERNGSLSKSFLYREEGIAEGQRTYKDVISVAIAYKVENSTQLDGVIVLYDYNALSVRAYAYDAHNKLIPCVSSAEFTLLCNHNGKIIDRIETTDKFKVGYEAVQDGLFLRVFFDRSTAQSAYSAMLGDSARSFSFSDGADGYVLTVNPLGAENGNFSLVCVYSGAKIFSEGNQLLSNVWASIIGLAVCVAIAVAATLINVELSKRREFLAESYDPTLNCHTPKRFERDVESILKRHGASGFALVSLRINNFSYVASKYGDAASVTLAKFCSDDIRRSLYAEETYAYAGEGEFLLLLHYRDRRAFTERLNAAYLRLSAFEGIGDDYKMTVALAVYEIERDVKQSVASMTEKLRIVKKDSPITIGTLSVTFYEDVLRENYVKKAEIESRMESALRGNEFHLFYQPKYNFRTKNMDGAEILIRWYDAKIGDYRKPAEFLPVFEEDGFITKLDRFVMYKACENVAARVAKRKICYPVSVNVSRVTAIQPDFVDYYVRIKKKFNIKDNFITVEFTESFAYENYDMLKEISVKLHENGFLCSIDDFGTGYSSYNVLKTIDIDEIKLDKFFLDKGVSEERDKTLLKSVVAMLKKLGFKVTQEGVETREDMLDLEGFGCDVIQGYYFAKPMKYSDYCAFVDNNFAK